MTTAQMYNPIRLVRPLHREGRERLLTEVRNAAQLVKLLTREGLRGCIHLQEPLAQHTTFRIGGIAHVMLCPGTEAELSKVVSICRESQVEPFILGGGSNLLIVQEVLPVVISLRRLKETRIQGTALYASAGVPFSYLVKTAVQNGLQGLEVLPGIPGTVGGALAGNAGGGWEGKSVEVGSCLKEVRVLTKDGTFRRFPKEAVCFEYRKSSLSGYVIVDAVFQFSSAPSAFLQERYQAALRKKIASQPLSDKSAGCVFKNPYGTSAWKLIRDAGLAGARIGAAMVSEKHTNFIVNLGGALGTDVLKLIHLIRDRVKQSAGVDLELEVKIW